VNKIGSTAQATAWSTAIYLQKLNSENNKYSQPSETPYFGNLQQAV
jgi:hypothetical protein